jgi:hypothetical protein
MRSVHRGCCAIALAFVLGHAGTAHAKDRTANNSVFAEGLGPGLLYSFNYERTVANDFALRIGAGYVSLGASAGVGGVTASLLSVPLVASYLGISSGNNALELGVGGIFIQASGEATGGSITATRAGNTIWGTAVIGYRRQPVNGGFMFRLGMSALIGEGLRFSFSDRAAVGVVPWPYLSLGATF